MKRLIFILTLFSTFLAFSAEKHAITFDDLFGMKRVSDPQLSPDGKWAAFVVTEYDIEENKGNSDIWLVSLRGRTPRKLTNSAEADKGPVWSPDSKKIAFTSSRSGESQIWVIPVDGGEAKPLTALSTGARDPIWSPDGKWIAFTSDVYPDLKNDEENKIRDEEKENSKVKAKVIDRLLFRHWNRWTDEKRSHLFIIPAKGGGARDLTPGDYDTPPLSLGSGHDYVFSPDSKEICYVKNTDPMVAISTNNDLFIQSVEVGESKRITISQANDNYPRYSPDSRYIAYRGMKRPGFEADRYRLILYDRKTGKQKSLTEDFDYTIRDFVWSPNSRWLYFTVPDRGFYSVCRIAVKGGKVSKLITRSYNRDLQVTPDGKTFLFLHQAVNHPFDLYTSRSDGKKVKQLTDMNGEMLTQLEMNPLDEFWFIGAGRDSVHGLMLKPPFFDPKEKYPLVYLIHGGPQGAWEDEFHYRWNAQMFASPGYVVAMVNFHASPGYGQAFTDAVSGDWGGSPYIDLMKGLDYITTHYDFIDTTRLAAAGASYGGYMINWIAGHSYRFRCLISHDGVYDLTSKYGATEELWFPEWEFRGTPWTNPEMYRKWSPSTYAANFKTPMLVIHGQNDFRVPVTQGFQCFTALQRQGVQAKLLYFPDEDHFVSKPQNARLWWQTVHGWLAEWLK